jgi:hypothetical protein
LKASDFKIQSTPNLFRDLIKFIQGSDQIYLRARLTFTTADKIRVSSTEDKFLHLDNNNKNAFLALINSGCLSQKTNAKGITSRPTTEFHLFGLPGVFFFKSVHNPRKGSSKFPESRRKTPEHPGNFFEMFQR